jgi:lipopolysaccharide/colanic/teichoic acid biosynthesis glycosyltransferase
MVAASQTLAGEIATRTDARLLPAAPGQAQRALGWYEAAKRAGDLLFALVLLVLSALPILLAMLLVKLTSRGPVFYSQVRVGRGGRPFTLHKIRTMTHKCESLTGIRWSTPGDPRITPVGRFLRRTHVDELPQLWNVVCGHMSLVGPRPERPEFVPHLEQAIPRYSERLLVRPGLTGLAQVQLPPDTDLESVRLKLAYDLYYVGHESWHLDLRLLVATALHVFHVPFPVIRRLIGLQSRDIIVRAYGESLVAARATRSRVQHV